MQHGAAVHGDRIYVAGGFSSLGGDALTSVESFDGTRWSALPTACAMPAAPRRGQVALASFGGRLLFAGAIDEATAVVDALTLDDAGLSCAWTRAPSLRVPRMNARLAVFDDRLFAVGGSNPPGNDTWLDETEALCPEPHAGASWRARATSLARPCPRLAAGTPAVFSASARWAAHRAVARAWAAAAADFRCSQRSMTARSSASDAPGSISNTLSNTKPTLHPGADKNR